MLNLFDDGKIPDMGKWCWKYEYYGNKNLNACRWQMHTCTCYIYIYILRTYYFARREKGYPRTPDAERGGHSLVGWLHIYLWGFIEIMHFCMHWLMVWEPGRLILIMKWCTLVCIDWWLASLWELILTLKFYVHLHNGAWWHDIYT